MSPNGRWKGLEIIDEGMGNAARAGEIVLLLGVGFKNEAVAWNLRTMAMNPLRRGGDR